MLNKLFHLVLLKDPKTGLHDVFMTASIFVIVLCAIRFFLEGMTFDLFGHILSFAHKDSDSYATLLSPVLGAHGAHRYMDNQQAVNRVDDPDQDLQ